MFLMMLEQWLDACECPDVYCPQCDCYDYTCKLFFKLNALATPEQRLQLVDMFCIYHRKEAL